MRELYGDALALLATCEAKYQALHREMAAVRSDLERAVVYGRLVGRFLFKRRRRILYPSV
jgi:hypothetical protein